MCLWALLLALISFNVVWRLTKPLAYSDKLIDVLARPFSAPAHESLAQTLTGSHARTLADRELTIVGELSPVLGASTTAKAKQEAADMIYWQHVLAGYPDYRDAYVQLAALTYGEGDIAQAHTYLVKAHSLDPNNATVNRLTDFTSKLLE